MLGFVKASDLVEKTMNSSSANSLQESVSLVEEPSIPGRSSANSIVPVSSIGTATVTDNKRHSDGTWDRSRSEHSRRNSSGSYCASEEVIDVDEYSCSLSGPSRLHKVHLDPNDLCEEAPSDSSSGGEATPTAPPVSGPGLSSQFGSFQLASSLVLSMATASSTHTPVTSSHGPSHLPTRADPAVAASIAVSRRGKKSFARPLPKITNFFETYVCTVSTFYNYVATVVMVLFPRYSTAHVPETKEDTVATVSVEGPSTVQSEGTGYGWSAEQGSTALQVRSLHTL